VQRHVLYSFKNQFLNTTGANALKWPVDISTNNWQPFRGIAEICRLVELGMTATSGHTICRTAIFIVSIGGCSLTAAATSQLSTCEGVEGEGVEGEGRLSTSATTLFFPSTQQTSAVNSAIYAAGQTKGVKFPLLLLPIACYLCEAETFCLPARI
jgi:hypothetical protein